MPLLEIIQTRQVTASIRLDEPTAVLIDQYAAFLHASADEVVDTSLRALSSGRLVVVPGFRYRLLVAMMRAFPRSIYHSLSIKYARSTGRDY